MQVRIGDLVLTEFDLTAPIQGLAKPSVRTAQGNYSGRDGGWLASQFYSPREIVIRGSYHMNTCQELIDKRAEIIDELPIRQSLDFFYTDFVGNIYFTEAYFIDLIMDINDRKYTEFEITLVAPDPYLYDGGDGTDPDSGWIEQIIEKVVGGGYITPYILPVEWEPSGQPTIVNNPSDVIIYPQIVLTGTFTNPEIINTTTGESIKANLTTTVGDVLIFDLRNRTITLNGGSVLPTMEGTWWGLVQGDNYISLFTDSGSDDDEGIIRYRIAFSGI
jgi:phage-related protein